MFVLPLPGCFTLIVQRMKGGDFVVPIYVSTTADAVPRERVAAPGAVARPAAVVAEAPVAHQAPVAVRPSHARLAGAVAIARVTEGHGAERKDGRSSRMAGTSFTGVWGREGSPEVAVEARLAALTVLTLSVVLAVDADTPASIPRCLPHLDVKVTGVGVPIALAGSALVRRPCPAVRCLPGPVVVQRCTVLTVAACSVVFTHALPVDHVECSWGLDGSEAINRDTLISMAIAEAAALDNEVIDGIVCKMLRLRIQVVSLTRAGLSLEQLHTEVGDL